MFPSNGIGETADAELKTEDEWGFVWAAIKLRRGRLVPRYRESWLRTASRVALLGMPGVSDHLPGDYARGLRLAVDAEASMAAAGAKQLDSPLNMTYVPA